MEEKAKALKQLLILRRAMVTLSPYIDELDIRSSDILYIQGTCHLGKQKYTLKFRCDRLLNSLTKELLRLEPAMIGGKVGVDEVKALIIALYTPAHTITKELRRMIKEHAGLFKNVRLRNKVISAKIMSARLHRTEMAIRGEA